jgi:hypothetical protein
MSLLDTDELSILPPVSMLRRGRHPSLLDEARLVFRLGSSSL